MTHRRELEQHRQTLGEIREIMNSMKTLAYMETRKLSRFLDAQRAAVEHIENVARDFLAYHPDVLAQTRRCEQVYLLFGSERGFCGDFNNSLLQTLEAHLRKNHVRQPRLLVTGNKLCMRLQHDPRVSAFIDGINVAEDVENMLNEVIDALNQLQRKPVSLNVLYHVPEQEQVVVKKVLPPFEEYRHARPEYPYAPLLNLPPDNFLSELMHHYLFSALHEMAYLALMTENMRRLQHLEGAVKHMDEEATKLLCQSNALRQEEIIEEIEVILLSSTQHDHERNKKYR